MSWNLSLARTMGYPPCLLRLEQRTQPPCLPELLQDVCIGAWNRDEPPSTFLQTNDASETAHPLFAARGLLVLPEHTHTHLLAGAGVRGST